MTACALAARHRLDERREEDFAQDPLGDVRGSDIGAALRLAMAGHVLERGEHVAGGERQRVALEAAHRGDAQLADEVRVFAVGFLDAAPARIARHVDHRRQHLVRTARARFSRRDRQHARDAAPDPRCWQARSASGKFVAPRAAYPCKASSWNIMGMPSRVLVIW